jgi:uncharacterized membrane protein YgcG
VRSALAFKPSYDRALAPPPHAARRRYTRRASKRKAGVAMRWIVIALVPLLMLIAYVGFTAELAAQTYRLNADQAEQAQLFQTTDELRQRVAQLQSVAKLEAAAAALQMKEPAHIAVITLPPTSTKPTTTAFAARLASFKRLFFAP